MMSTKPRNATTPVLDGYDDSVPGLANADMRSASKLIPFEQFSDEAAGYVISLIETWCDRNTSQAAHELRFVLEQAKWCIGYKEVCRLFLSQLPENPR